MQRLCHQEAPFCHVPAVRVCQSERRLRPALRRSTRCHSWHSDVLLVDAQNMLSRAHADHRRGCRLVGETAASSFAAWLLFLVTAAQPQLLVAVFDSPAAKRGKQQQQRQALAPEYLRRRQRRKQSQAEPGSRSSAAARTALGSSPAAQQAAGDPLRPYKRKVAELGGLSLEAAGGWEADDGLAAASAAVRGRHPAARILLASGDGDMQQLLDSQVLCTGKRLGAATWLPPCLPIGAHWQLFWSPALPSPALPQTCPPDVPTRRLHGCSCTASPAWAAPWAWSWSPQAPSSSSTASRRQPTPIGWLSWVRDAEG